MFNAECHYADCWVSNFFHSEFHSRALFWCLYQLIFFSNQQNSCNDNLKRKLLDTKWNSSEGFFATFGNKVFMLSVKFLPFWVSFWRHFWCLYHLIFFFNQQNSCNGYLEQKLLDTKWNSSEGFFFCQNLEAFSFLFLPLNFRIEITFFNLRPPL